VVRNGHLPEREIVSGIGPIKVRQPRVRHRDQGRFSSAILPRFMRRTPSVDALIPALYLKGISTGDFTEALAAILGEKASGLSATNIVRLKVGWEADYKAWSQRDLSQKRYVYWWADGVYFNVRLDEERTCVLVLIGATEDGTCSSLTPAYGIGGGLKRCAGFQEIDFTLIKDAISKCLVEIQDRLRIGTLPCPVLKKQPDAANRSRRGRDVMEQRSAFLYQSSDQQFAFRFGSVALRVFQSPDREVFQNTTDFLKRPRICSLAGMTLKFLFLAIPPIKPILYMCVMSEQILWSSAAEFGLRVRLLVGAKRRSLIFAI
jgi:hypothetical protein